MSPTDVARLALAALAPPDDPSATLAGEMIGSALPSVAALLISEKETGKRFLIYVEEQ